MIANPHFLPGCFPLLLYLLHRLSLYHHLYFMFLIPFSFLCISFSASFSAFLVFCSAAIHFCRYIIEMALSNGNYLCRNAAWWIINICLSCLSFCKYYITAYLCHNKDYFFIVHFWCPHSFLTLQSWISEHIRQNNLCFCSTEMQINKGCWSYKVTSVS